MSSVPESPAEIVQPAPRSLALKGAWTARGIGVLARRVGSVRIPAGAEIVANGAGVEALDTAGAWVLQGLLARLREEGNVVRLEGLQPGFVQLLDGVARPASAPEAPTERPSMLERVGRATAAAYANLLALLAFVGESALALAGCVANPLRMRWRPILFNIRSAGFDAMPIVGLLSFLLGIVIAYQGADQLRQYGANIFIADLVGLSMVREFGPLLTAIVIAGRSGSAYAAQIGTMAVTEEIDAMRTIGIAPLDLLVVPKLLALLVALPLLTVLADAFGILGGMIMAQSQLDVGYGEFLDRLVKAVSVTAYLIGVLKAPVFAAIIATVGCYQGFRTKGGADSVGRQTTRAVVQSIFLVIVADALLSVAFSALGL